MDRHHDNSVVGNATSVEGPSNENGGRCVICDLKPESDRRIKFLHVYAHADGHRKLYEVIARLLGFEGDTEPKVVCEECHKKIMVLVKVYKRISRLLDHTTPEPFDSP